MFVVGTERSDSRDVEERLPAVQRVEASAVNMATIWDPVQ